MASCDYNAPGAINIGAGDGICTTLDTGYGPVDLDLVLLGSAPIKTHGDGGWDFVYYERAADPGIQMDYVTIQLSSDGNIWYTVFAYGNDIYYNSSISGFGQYDNELIPLSFLIGGVPRTGIGIDIDDARLNSDMGIPPGDYRYLRIISPPDSGDGLDVDAIEVK